MIEHFLAVALAAALVCMLGINMTEKRNRGDSLDALIFVS